MTTRYVGPGGNDGNSGLTWALRKLTLNGVEDTPVVANDLVYVGPGTYRELLTCDVSGGAGTEIVYVADVTGEHTDGIGGIVRITGSDNDQTTNRANAIDGNGTWNRTFRGFRIDGCAFAALNNLRTGWTIEDCIILENEFEAIYTFISADYTDIVIRRCVFYNNDAGIHFDGVGDVEYSVGTLIENCIFIGRTWEEGVRSRVFDDITIRNCLFMGWGEGVKINQAIAGTVTVNNCIFIANNTALLAQAGGDIIENFNTFYNNNTDRTNTNVGANSQAYMPLLASPFLFSGVSQVSGFKFPWWFGELSEWSQVKRIAGTGEAAEDFFGITRPTTSAKKSWGAIQFADVEVESGTVQAGTYARVLNDAGSVFVRRVPCTAVSTTVTLYVRRQADYAGSVPRMVIKQPGQSDRTKDMTAAVDTWEQLSDTFTPAANPGFFEIWVESRNTAAAGSYKVFYDTMAVS